MARTCLAFRNGWPKWPKKNTLFWFSTFIKMAVGFRFDDLVRIVGIEIIIWNASKLKDKVQITVLIYHPRNTWTYFNHVTSSVSRNVKSVFVFLFSFGVLLFSFFPSSELLKASFGHVTQSLKIGLTRTKELHPWTKEQKRCTWTFAVSYNT